MRKTLFFVLFTLLFTLAPNAGAQVMMEFTWTLQGVNYEGLLYVPRDKPATMTVRVLDAQGKLAALVLERVDMVPGENGAVTLKCFSPKILVGPADRQHACESFTAQEEAQGRVSNGAADAPYEINLINDRNIESVVKKYLKSKDP
ncbi:MAG: hypothetical protein IJQ31_05760 [Thermoguttaceae bacterium]|nr:hypothetical protein [Thermoguttaceae bacterium]